MSIEVALSVIQHFWIQNLIILATLFGLVILMQTVANVNRAIKSRSIKRKTLK